jgi:hypothetical protein
MRLVAGKVLMDRHAPEALSDGDVAGTEAISRALIGRWHGRGRLAYAVTVRFAVTSTPQQLAMAGRLMHEIPGLYMQTHVAENRAEVAWVAELFPRGAQLPGRLPPRRPARPSCGAGPRHLAGRHRPPPAGRHRRADRPQPQLQPLPRQRPAGLAGAGGGRPRRCSWPGRSAPSMSAAAPTWRCGTGRPGRWPATATRWPVNCMRGCLPGSPWRTNATWRRSMSLDNSAEPARSDRPARLELRGISKQYPAVRPMTGST